MTDMTNANSALTDQERKRLADILDVLIPAEAQMPAATLVEVHLRWIDEALRLRPDLRADLDAALTAVSGGPPSTADALRAFARAQLGAFTGAGNLIAGAYYMDDRVRQALGYPGQEARPLVDEVETYLEMLERVVERGPIYRTITSEAGLHAAGNVPIPRNRGNKSE